MKYNIELTDQQLNTVLFSLQKQSFEMVNEVINNIVTQIKNAQVKQTEETKIVE